MRIATLLILPLTLLAACQSPSSGDTNIFASYLGKDARVSGEIMKYGYPGYAMLRHREGYVVSYDSRNRVPVWVAERLNAERLAANVPRENMTFNLDESIPEESRSLSTDYQGGEHVRGRLAAAANHQDNKLRLEETYLLSNVCPQIGARFRQAFWVKFEKQVREWAMQTRDLYVFTGPLYMPEKGSDGRTYVRYEVIGENHVAVPTHFFKVMVSEKGRNIDVQAFIVPHRNMEGPVRFSDYLVSVDQVEKLSGLDFFSSMPQSWQKREESIVPEAAWGESAEAPKAACGCVTEPPK
ncbi:MAG: DNA/RNA non-specific endonuclease [Planctomycetota bacterium]|jgi:endonuclease G